ncbi:hypothetical protein FQA39_LY00296 [Lamprigera yunnana]|nr:hypothetical protein FQA39_LY00296 [Lamprigera yunnana]
MRDSTRFQDVNEEGQDVENFNSQSDGDEEDVELSDVSNEDKEDKHYESKYVDDMDRRSKLAVVVHEAIAIPAKKLKLNISYADSEILRKSFNDHISNYLFEPMQQDQVESEEDSTAAENLCILSAGSSQVEAGSSTSLTIASKSAAENPRPLVAAQSRDTTLFILS